MGQASTLFALLIALPAIIQRRSGMRSTERVRLVEACVAFGKRDLFTYAIVDGGFGSSMEMYGYASTDGLHREDFGYWGSTKCMPILGSIR
jgi:hypothetical protein